MGLKQIFDLFRSLALFSLEVEDPAGCASIT
jgi:hypothetical protein